MVGRTSHFPIIRLSGSDFGSVRRRPVDCRSRYGLKCAPRARPGSHPLLGARLRSALRAVQFETEIDLDSLPYLGEHEVQGSVIFPAAAYLEMALAAAAEFPGEGRAVLTRFQVPRAPRALRPGHVAAASFPGAEPVAAGRRRTIGISDPRSAGWGRRLDAGAWKLFASGDIARETVSPTTGPADCSMVGGKLDLAAVRSRCPQPVARDVLYARLAAAGLKYGPSFRGVGRVSIGYRQALGEIDVPSSIVADAKSYRMHPAILDASLHVLAAALGGDVDLSHSSFLPVGVRRMVCRADCRAALGNRFQVHATYRRKLGAATTYSSGTMYSWSTETIEGDLRLCDEQGNVMVEIEGLCLRRLGRRASTKGMFARSATLRSPVAAGRNAGHAFRQKVGRATLEQGKWLIFADRQGVGRELARMLQDHGCCCLLSSTATTVKTCGPAQHSIPVEFSAELAQLLDHCHGDVARPWQYLVHLWSLDAGEDSSLDRAAAMSCGRSAAGKRRSCCGAHQPVMRQRGSSRAACISSIKSPAGYRSIRRCCGGWDVRSSTSSRR